MSDAVIQNEQRTGNDGMENEGKKKKKGGNKKKSKKRPAVEKVIIDIDS